MIEIILHDICDTFPYLKYGLAAAVCTALALRPHWGQTP